MVSGTASISESMRIKPVEERCPESFLAEIEIHVGLEGSKGRWLAHQAGNTFLHLELCNGGYVFPAETPHTFEKIYFSKRFFSPLDRGASSHLKGICFVCSGWLYS